jgi:phosphatidylglycerophosphate synthase
VRRLEAKTIQGRLDGKRDGCGAADGTATSGITLVQLGTVARGAPHDPDRVADPLFLVPLGYAAGYSWLGWLAALLAVLTAYIRVLGGALGQQQDFGGILPKQRRMAVLTIALLAAAVEDSLWGSRMSLLAAAIIIALGSLATCISRTLRIARLLETPP